MDVRELFSPRTIATRWNNDPFNQNAYVGLDLFLPKKKMGLDLSWIRGTRGVPITLKVSAFDAQATYRDREGISLTETEMPFFREGYKIKEKDRQDLVRLQDYDDAVASAVVQRIFDDYNDLIRGARVARERMAMQLLFPNDIDDVNGYIGIKLKANGATYNYNYDDPAGTWKANNYTALTSTKQWSAPATSDPFTDFQTVQNAIRARTGVKPTVAIMNSNTFQLMAKSKAIKDRYVAVNNVSLAALMDAEIESVIKRTVGVTIIRYDEQYRDENKQVQSFVPDNYVALIPDTGTSQPLGNMWMAYTPEEIDLEGTGKADVQVVDTGVAITQEILVHPVNINTFASMICLPSFERMDECALLKVA